MTERRPMCMHRRTVLQSLAVGLGAAGLGPGLFGCNEATGAATDAAPQRDGSSPSGPTGDASAPGEEADSGIEVPPAGRSQLVVPAGAHQGARPASLTQGNWNYALFGSFGSGTFNPHYSANGAFILACSGGHGHPHFFGAAVFDFTSMSWSYLPCENPGLTADAANSAVPAEQTTRTPYWEMLEAAGVPSPPHPYKNQAVLAPEHGGSAKGTMIYVARYSVDAVGGAGCAAVHGFDLVTQRWSRLSADDSFGWINGEGDTVFDPVTVRYYQLAQNQHNYDHQRYWDPISKRFENGPTQSSYINDNTAGGPWSLSGFIHEGGGVRALIQCRRDPTTGNYALAGLDLGNQETGWIRRLALDGDPISVSDHAAWVYHPVRNAYYRRPKRNMGQTLHCLVPPSGNPLTGTWTHGSVTLDGDEIPEFVGPQFTESGGYRSLMYVPALQVLGWVTPNGVALLNV